MPTAPRKYLPNGKPREKSWASRKTEHYAWYNLWIWRGPRGLRMQILQRDPICRECADKGLVVPSTQVDHIVPHAGNWQRFTDPLNLVGLCASCHSAKTRRENG